MFKPAAVIETRGRLSLWIWLLNVLSGTATPQCWRQLA